MITNFFRIKVPLEVFHIQRLPYSEEKLHTLKQEHNKIASFFRYGDFIYISPSKGSGLELGNLVEVRIDESPRIVLSLIRHLIFRNFRNAFPDRVPQSFSPLRFFSTKDEHDPLRKLLPAGLCEQVSYPRMIEVEARQIQENGKPSFGLLIRSRQRWQLKVNLRGLVEEGFKLVGKSVLETEPIPGLEGVLAPDENLLGEIVSIHGDEVEIITNDGVVRRRLDCLQMQRTHQQIGAFLAFKLGEQKATRIFESLRNNRREREQPNFFFAEARKYAAWFSRGCY